jgi:hypothetical protein
MVARDASIILDWHQGALDCQYTVLIESMFPEMEFLVINLTENLSLMLHTIHSLFYWGILQKTILYFGF